MHCTGQVPILVHQRSMSQMMSSKAHCACLRKHMHFTYSEEKKADESSPASAATIGTARTFGMVCNSSSASFLAARQTSTLGRTLRKFFCTARSGSAEPARLLDNIIDVCMVKRTQEIAELYAQEAY